MHAQDDKPKYNKIRAISNSVTQKTDSEKQGFGFVVNRSKAVAKRKLKVVVNNHFPASPIQRHALLGAMIKGEDNPAELGDSSWDDLELDKVFDSSIHRGDLNNARTGQPFNWNENDLLNKVKKIRTDSGFEEDDPNFIVVANVNTYKTPGYESIPSSQTDNKHLYAFGSGWKLSYNIAPEPDKPDDYSSNYTEVLNAWTDLPKYRDQMVDEDDVPEKLGEKKAKDTLRKLTKEYWSANKNFVIPHRGLRNMALEEIHNLGLVNKLQQRKIGNDDFVSIITLDDDLQIKDKGLIKRMMEAGSADSQKEIGRTNRRTKKGVAFSSPGYIYNKEDNLLEYTASILSHIGGRTVRLSYPSEPGLTFTYDRSIEDSVWEDFLLNSPWGIEHPDLNQLVAYGTKQQKARVESKEGRAFAYNFALYLSNKRGALRKSTATNKIPLRDKGYFSVDMSKIAREEILKNTPGNLSDLSKEEVGEWILHYIKKNRYHTLGGNAESPTNFKKNVLPRIADFVFQTIHSGSSESEKETIILQALENYGDENYKEAMSGQGDTAIEYNPMELGINYVRGSVRFEEINNGRTLRLASISIATSIENAINNYPNLDEEMDFFISNSIEALNLDKKISEVMDFLVAGIIYDEDYSEALDDLREDEDYKQYIDGLDLYEVELDHLVSNLSGEVADKLKGMTIVNHLMLLNAAFELSKLIQAVINDNIDLQHEVSRFTEACVKTLIIQNKYSETTKVLLDLMVAEMVDGTRYDDEWDNLREDPNYTEVVNNLGR